MVDITTFPIPTKVLSPVDYPEFKGEPGTNGTNGTDGTDAAEITSASFTAGDMVFVKDDLTSFSIAGAQATLTGPEGPTGPKGDNFQIDASGLLSARSTYDAEPEGFAYLATDTGDLYLREGVSGWSAAIPFQGPAGPQGAAAAEITSASWNDGAILFTKDDATTFELLDAATTLKGEAGDPGVHVGTTPPADTTLLWLDIT